MKAAAGGGDDRTFDDYKDCKNDANIMAQLKTDQGEEVIFSCAVAKYNRWGMKQERTLLLTNHSLYNIKKDNIQRKIGILSIKAITKSTKGGNFEFVVHIKNEYDYRFESDYRD